jgi:hypothetical protein
MTTEESTSNPDPLALLPDPAPGEMRIVTLEGSNTFMAMLLRDQAERTMDAFEHRAGLTAHGRTSRETHASIRIAVAEGLRRQDADARYTDVLAAAVLWLAMRHWSDGEAIMEGVDAMLAAGETPVLTASIAEADSGRFLLDTAWAFMVGRSIHDGRGQLSDLGPEEVRVIGKDA